MSKYMNRLVDQALANELEAFGAVYITGPKWCGKTTTGMQLAKNMSIDLDRVELSKKKFKKTNFDNII